MQIKKVFFILFIIINQIYTQYTFKCKDSDDSNLGYEDTIVLCIHFLESKQKVAIQVKVDDYSLISVKGAYNKIIEENLSSNQHIVAQIGTKYTIFPSVYLSLKDKAVDQVFSLFNIVVKINEGSIYEIVWDNGCFDCEDACISNKVQNLTNANSTQIEENCKALNSTYYDPQFYITWFGTDKDKRQMKTSNMAMSKFKHYSISSLVGSIKDLF